MIQDRLEKQISWGHNGNKDREIITTCSSPEDHIMLQIDHHWEGFFIIISYDFANNASHDSQDDICQICTFRVCRVDCMIRCCPTIPYLSYLLSCRWSRRLTYMTKHYSKVIVNRLDTCIYTAKLDSFKNRISPEQLCVLHAN